MFFNDHRERRHGQRRVEGRFKPRNARPSVSVCWLIWASGLPERRAAPWERCCCCRCQAEG